MCPQQLVPRNAASVSPGMLDDTYRRGRPATSLETAVVGGGNEEGQSEHHATAAILALDRNQQTRLQALSVTTASAAGVAAYIINVECACFSVICEKMMHQSQLSNAQVLALALLVSIFTAVIHLSLLLYKFYHAVSDILKDILEAETNNSSSSSSLMSALWRCLALRFVAGALLGVYFGEVSARLVFQGSLNSQSAWRGLVVACLFVSAVYAGGSIASATGSRQQQQQSQQQRISLPLSEPLLSQCDN